MVEIKYKIQNYTNFNTEENLQNIQSNDRNLQFIYRGQCFSLTIEFETCILSEIHIGLLYDSKIIIEAWHKSQQIKKKIINKSESVNNIMKAIVYKSNQFLNFKNSEISILKFSFQSYEKVNCVGLTYITLIKQVTQNHLTLSPVHKTLKKPVYDFIDSKKSQLSVTESIGSDCIKNLETGQKLFESEFAKDYQGIVKSEEPVSKINGRGKVRKEIDMNIHTNSYAGVAKGIVIWLICGDEIRNVMREICDVLGILVLDQPSDIIDFIVCEHYNSTILSLSQGCEKPVLGHEWLLECLNTRSKAKTSQFLYK